MMKRRRRGGAPARAAEPSCAGSDLEARPAKSAKRQSTHAGPGDMRDPAKGHKVHPIRMGVAGSQTGRLEARLLSNCHEPADG